MHVLVHFKSGTMAAMDDPAAEQLLKDAIQYKRVLCPPAHDYDEIIIEDMRGLIWSIYWLGENNVDA